MDILMFQSRCRDSRARLWREGMKLQAQRRKFQSRNGILVHINHPTNRKYTYIPLESKIPHRCVELSYGLPTLYSENTC